MRKYGKWALTLGLMAATPGLGLAAPWTRTTDADQAASKSPAEKPAAADKATKPGNQQMADRIAVSLRDARLQGYDIEIEYKNGTAILKGRVVDPKQKEKATKVVERIPGIERVDNQLVLTTPKAAVAGAEARGKVTQASATGESRESRRVTPINFEQEPAAGPAVAPASYAPANNNQEVAEQIGAALTAAQLDGYEIEIRYQDGAAILGGVVGTMAEREAAERVVSQVPGVMSVQNHLRPAREPMPQQRPVQMASMQQGGYPGMGHPGMGPQGPMMGPQGMGPQGMGPQGPMMGPQGPIQPVAYQGMMGPGGMPAYCPPGHPGHGAPSGVYNGPSLPDHAWPSYAQYPNSAAVTYPQQYSASAFPYIGPFYPYPQVPMGWRDASLRWDDGQWNLQFRQRTDKWWWFLSPKNW